VPYTVLSITGSPLKNAPENQAVLDFAALQIQGGFVATPAPTEIEQKLLHCLISEHVKTAVAWECCITKLTIK
jgi:hypothetical protein